MRKFVRSTGSTTKTACFASLRFIPAPTDGRLRALAKRIGKPSAVRAVGLANGANPIGIVVPCHRVVGADGSLTGYAGGLQRKRWLIAHEARHAVHPPVEVRAAQ